ncbi:hypothetical protein MGYG_04900 [Nannizzia gypsea CBS 118893]|uniref:DUF202 domain-containing protein n=1 Tax=Arthroderma gypseum (strain ATCC MYA-4604 / CBS 118893) TaxID=535722 RepID=E4UXF2_ARTGP|nr:hypothetical protein MGYG_04900 [Nannizzia gypsea CBS 118893]EFR01900.1 hypothetical protein MGYG_04900 [Nannizzia gypsea CBS 118893]
MPHTPEVDVEDDPSGHPFGRLSNPFSIKPVNVTKQVASKKRVVFTKPLFGALLLENSASDARDHCANERTFLAWLRLSMYLSIVSSAIVLSFHLRAQPTALERNYALPLGILFWVLALGTIISGVANYIHTLAKYSRRAALVQSGWKTQVIFCVVAVVIIGTCILFLSTNRRYRSTLLYILPTAIFATNLA